MKKLLSAAIAAVAVLACATPAVAQTKIRVAIWDFENNSEGSWWFHNQLGDAARNQIDNAFSENDELSRLFTVVEREKLAMVLKEQGLASTGAVDPQSAAKVGQILGVKYIITGGIDKFAINTTRGGFGRLAASSTNAEASISLRFIDTTTAERVVSVSADGNVRKGGGRFGSANLSREDEWGIASEAVEKASEEVVKKLTASNSLERVSEAAGSGGGVDMRVIKADGTTAYINVGRTSGIKVGDTFTIHRKGEDLIDPTTGMNLGATEKQVGTAVVTEVQDRFAIVTITGTAAAADVIKKTN
ncbi:MAG TPA: CsgG/HfaB family protein [Vicinamibacterales bacterium]|nr:CsgG/HfaB family protein [Vicinamibacterales bacterium]